ncbi:MAG: sigma-70 family RNA polymerase sigma factor, partial [Chloroflexi bacterium]|nr:sigma-70 family RNA polymerase sigma factor [Chloroflexota bacterium]
RGIVHHQCCRYLRKRRFDTIPLDDAIGVPEAAIGPAQYLERREALDRILAAIGALPDAQREVAALYYIKDYAQREIAAFLDVPVSTVNNRLHAARQQLRGDLRPMTEHTTTTTTPPASLTPPTPLAGQVVRAQGPIIDARFAGGALPGLMGRATITDEASGRAWTAQVVQHLDDKTVRCIVTDDAEGIAQGLAVRDAGGAVHASIDAAILERALPLLGNPRHAAMSAEARTEPRTVLETGIKVIDLMCPYVVDGKVGVAGHPGSGKLVMLQQLVRNLEHGDTALSLVELARVREATLAYEGKEEAPQPHEALQWICVATANPTDPTDPASLVASGLLDAMTYTSYALGVLGIWPAVDPLLSWSRHLDPAVVGQEHYDVALGVRRLLRRYRDLQEGLDGGGALSPEDKTVIARARRVQRFFTQPFSVAEPFTQRKGQYVSRAETVRGFKALLEGAYDDLPEEAFLWCGPIAQAVEHAKALRA